MSRLRGSGILFYGSLGLAVLLGLMPMPELLAPFKPYWLGLVLIYWLLEAPERAGLGMAFGIGLVADLVFGTLFGEQALRLVMLAFIVQRFRPRLRFFPLWQQASAVFALLLNDRVIAAAVRLFSGETLPPLAFWLSPLTALLLWPWLFLLLDELRLRGRARES
ncbi:rod shape-determining protein MreD [Rehaibacterium terrae]|jgi:rod shape-determining protein MreD|uniref:Rod shape-determining protein MreD n=1 Tax=Rehaibacterium terrae TaxID=1341696 RepID=A0A7W7V7E4_9GAMM|nr:rod shape-determining protein MreD [Rehaibacterium terrae]MBB5014637.1 rod shape-determining protein MreD [Rehaibacterium terrae]